MSERATYIHGTAPDEQDRLAALNRLTNQAFIDFVGPQPGQRVLEVGSGLGLLACQMAGAADGATVVGVEQAPAQIAAARRHARVSYVRGDAHRLPAVDGAFDVVYARYVLEHLADPAAALAEMHRVVRPGGTVAVCENDVSLVRLDPPCPAFERLWLAFQRLQASLGGDSLIGRRLYRLFRDAGFTQVELSGQPEMHWHGSPAFSGWVRNLAGNVASARDGLLRARFTTEEELAAVEAELAAFATSENASLLFMWNRAKARR